MNFAFFHIAWFKNMICSTLDCNYEWRCVRSSCDRFGKIDLKIYHCSKSHYSKYDFLFFKIRFRLRVKFCWMKLRPIGKTALNKKHFSKSYNSKIGLFQNWITAMHKYALDEAATIRKTHLKHWDCSTLHYSTYELFKHGLWLRVKMFCFGWSCEHCVD